MKKLERHRAQIDVTDRQIVRLLNRRMRLASQVGELKQQNGLPVVDSERERNVLQRVAQLSEGPLEPSSLTRIFRSIIQESRRTQLRRLDQGESK